MSTTRAASKRGPSKRVIAQRPRRVVVRGAIVVAILALIGYVALRAYEGVPFKPYKTMYVEVRDVGNLLRAWDQVRIAGKRVGIVKELNIKKDGTARVRLQLEPWTRDLPVDTKVTVRAAGLLGARYIELTPGRSRELLAEGATIRGGDAKTYGLPEGLNTFDAPTRERFGDMNRELGTALIGNGERLNDGIRLGAPAQRPFQSLVRTVLARPGSVERFVPSLHSMMLPFDEVRYELAESFAPTSAALRPFVDRQGSVQQLFERAPAALSAADRGLGNGRRLLAATGALARSVNVTLPAAPAGLRAATRLLDSGSEAMPETEALLRAAEPAIPATLAITRRLSPVLAPLEELLGDFVPLTDRIGRYGCDISNFAANYRSMTGFSSPGATGPQGQFRLQAAPSPAEAGQFSTPADPKRSLAPRDPYPEPCKYTTRRSTVEPLRGGK